MRVLQIMRIGLAPALAAAALLSGCSSDSPPTAPRRILAPQYLVPSSISAVLLNLGEAYTHKDSTETKSIYDINYVGTSQDLNDPGNNTIQFTYADEVDHVARLARDPNVSTVYFSLGPLTSWTRLGSDDPSHPDWAVIQISGSNIDVEVRAGISNYIVHSPTEFFQFSFQPTTPAPSSPSDTLWKIIRWMEIKSAGG